LAESYGISAKPINVAQTYRLYLRCWTDKASVLAAVGANNPENSIWRYFGAKFAAIGLPVPIFYYSNIIFDEEHKNFVNLAIIEDCGNESLVAFAQRQVSSGAIVDAYKDAADTLACWHSRGLAAFDSPHELQLPHSFQMVRDVLWKRFTDNYGLLGLPVPFPSPGIMAEGLELCRKVEFEGMGKVLLHNEYQGRNLLMSRSGLKAIDWAGARMGPAICDLASLLYDPEVSLSHEAKAEIVETYFKVMGAKAEIGPFMRDMGLTALMWLLCLFGNNAYKFGRIHIQSAVGCLKPIMARLREIAAFLGPIGCPSIYRLIDDTLAGLDSVFPPTENNQGQGLNS
jgi:hypothetical protein